MESKVISDTQWVAIRTKSGVQLHDYAPELVDVSWSREAQQTSRCTITVPANYDVRVLNMVSVWDDTGQERYWDGIITGVESNDTTTKLTCNDIGWLFKRTRCPIGKSWQNADPADIANELVTAMLNHHGLDARPIVRHDPYIDKIDYQVTADAATLDSHMDDLVRRGLTYTIIAGVPILGPLSRTAITALDKDHFVGDGMTLVQDATNTFNDVLLRSQAPDARTIVDMAGWFLQTIYQVDSVTSVSDADVATKQYARYVSRLHETVSLPSNAVLHPGAPITIKQLIPSARLNIDAFGKLFPVQVTGVDVSCTPGTSTVSPRVESVDDNLPELITLQSKQQGLGVSTAAGLTGR